MLELNNYKRKLINLNILSNHSIKRRELVKLLKVCSFNFLNKYLFNLRGRICLPTLLISKLYNIYFFINQLKSSGHYRQLCQVMYIIENSNRLLTSVFRV